MCILYISTDAIIIMIIPPPIADILTLCCFDPDSNRGEHLSLISVHAVTVSPAPAALLSIQPPFSFNKLKTC